MRAMQARTPGERFSFRLIRLARYWRTRLDSRVKPLGLTQAKWVTLVYLARGGDGMLQKDLARFIGIEGPTLVRLLDSLAKAGLVERRAVDGDRRGRTVHLTPRSRPLLASIGEVARDLRVRLLAGVRRDELRTCIDVLERIMANADALDAAEQNGRRGRR